MLVAPSIGVSVSFSMNMHRGLINLSDLCQCRNRDISPTRIGGDARYNSDDAAYFLVYELVAITLKNTRLFTDIWDKSTY